MESLHKDIKQIHLFNTNFSPLAGVLGVGFCLHPMAVPIMRNNLHQQHNERDLIHGYVMVFLSYAIIGVFGYFGFTGIYFEEYQKVAYDDQKPIAQNCIQMFGRADVLAFILRIIVFSLVFSAFPILHHFFRASLLKLIYSQRKASKPTNHNEEHENSDD